MKTTYDDIQGGDIVLVNFRGQKFQLVTTDEVIHSHWRGKILDDQGYESSVDRDSFAGFWNVDELCDL